MSYIWTWERRILPERPRRAAHDTRGYATWLRGRAFRSQTSWCIEVTNTHSGERIVYDHGHAGLADAFASAEFATAAARQAWMRGLRQKELKA